MQVAKTPFFVQVKDGSVRKINAGEPIPDGVDAEGNTRPVPDEPQTKRATRKETR